MLVRRGITFSISIFPGLDLLLCSSSAELIVAASSSSLSESISFEADSHKTRQSSDLLRLSRGLLGKASTATLPKKHVCARKQALDEVPFGIANAAEEGIRNSL